MKITNASPSDAARRLWRERWLAEIYEFSDLQTQRRLWLNLGDSSEMSSFAELMCRYFDDLSVLRGTAQLVLKGYLTAEEAAAVEPLNAAALGYEEGDKYEEEILADPKWLQVIAVAQSVKAALRLLLSDAAELEVLQNG